MEDHMTSRERFIKTLNHEEPDRVPIDAGQDLHNGIHEVAYRNLLNYLGEMDDIVIYDHMQHLAVVKESVLKRLHVDTKYIFCNGPSEWEFKRREDGSWADEWGIIRNTCGYYDESIDFPLKNCTMEKICNYRWPDPKDPARFSGLRERTRELYEGTDFALIGGNPATFFFLTSELMGFQEYMEKLLTDRPMIEELVEKMLEFWIEFFDAYLEEIGEYIEMVWMGDDWGMQTGPIMNPRLFREIFTDKYRQLITFIKKKYPVKVALHSCGSVKWCLDDLIDVGFDVVHPLQGDAEEMKDPVELKEKFGDRLVFYSNLRNQSTIPHGTPDEVKLDVIKKLQSLAPGGGYIISGGHNIQADVPPENIITLFDTAMKSGVYPIQV